MNRFDIDIPEIGICHRCRAPAKVGGLSGLALQTNWPSEGQIRRMLISCCKHVLTISDDKMCHEVKLLLLNYHRSNPQVNQMTNASIRKSRCLKTPSKRNGDIFFGGGKLGHLIFACGHLKGK